VKRERSLSSQYYQWESLQNYLQRILFVLFFLPALLLNSCTNIGSGGFNPTSTISLSNPNVGSGSNFTLVTVLPSEQSPGVLYDMVGQNGEFNTYCTGANAPCVCSYTFSQPGVIGTQVLQGTVSTAAATAQESNLLQCTNPVTTGVTSFSVQVLSANGTYSSNAITVNLASNAFANSNNFIDLTQKVSYQQVKRFQCRHREFILDPMSNGSAAADDKIIDPIQSQDPDIIYPFNYYSTNVASSLWSIQNMSAASGGSVDFDCTLIPSQNHALQWWANPNVYSVNPCTDTFCLGDGQLMDPQTSLISGDIPVTNLSGEWRKGREWKNGGIDCRKWIVNPEGIRFP